DLAKILTEEPVIAWSRKSDETGRIMLSKKNKTAIEFAVPYYRPYFTGREREVLARLCASEDISTEGRYSEQCARQLETKLKSREVLLTTSCTGALELAAILLDLG